MPSRTARTWSSSVAARADPVVATTNAATTPPVTTSPLRALVPIIGPSFADARSRGGTARRAKKYRLERNRLNLDGVEHADKHFAYPLEDGSELVVDSFNPTTKTQAALT